MTESELNEIEQRCNRASKGEWKSYIEGRDHESGSNFIMTGIKDGEDIWNEKRGTDIYLTGATSYDQDLLPTHDKTFQDCWLKLDNLDKTMIEIEKNLFVGNLINYQELQYDSEFYFVQACKEPCHRTALGYTGRTADKNHPEYLIAYRERRIILNMIDPPTGKYFENVLFEKSLDFIDENLKNGNKVLIHCNQGVSRSPSIGMLYLATKDKIKNGSFELAMDDFQQIYPNYQPSGIREFLTANWNHYIKICG